MPAGSKSTQPGRNEQRLKKRKEQDRCLPICLRYYERNNSQKKKPDHASRTSRDHPDQLFGSGPAAEKQWTEA